MDLSKLIKYLRVKSDMASEKSRALFSKCIENQEDDSEWSAAWKLEGVAEAYSHVADELEKIKTLSDPKIREG